MKNRYYNLRENLGSDGIETLFPEWIPGRERVAVFGPHDDDPLIGAGYAMAAALEAGAEVFAVIFCRGDCGYTRIDQKDGIAEIRRRETIDAYGRFGIDPGHIIRFDYPDFGAADNIGYHLPDGRTGSLPGIFQLIRGRRITRLLLPNGYREHTDHTAVFDMGAFDPVQAGDPILCDLGAAQTVRSFLQYAVWSDFSPEDMLASGGANGIRANRAIVVPPQVEARAAQAIRAFETQGEIIRDLIAARERRFTGDGYIELYLDFDPRPKLDFGPYIEMVNRLPRP